MRQRAWALFALKTGGLFVGLWGLMLLGGASLSQPGLWLRLAGAALAFAAARSMLSAGLGRRGGRKARLHRAAAAGTSARVAGRAA